MVSQCPVCSKFATCKAKEEEVVLRELLDRPMEKVHVDLFELNKKQHLFLVDDYSTYSLYHEFNKYPNTGAVIKVLKGWFAEYGYPIMIRSDNGPHFKGEFERFCKAAGIKVTHSSPNHHESNGFCEHHLGTLKSFLKKAGDTRGEFREYIAKFRMMPIGEDGVSPAQLFFGWDMRHLDLPHFERDMDFSILGKEVMRRQQEHKLKRNMSVLNTLPTPITLHVGACVLLQDDRTKL